MPKSFYAGICAGILVILQTPAIAHAASRAISAPQSAWLQPGEIEIAQASSLCGNRAHYVIPRQNLSAAQRRWLNLTIEFDLSHQNVFATSIPRSDYPIDFDYYALHYVSPSQMSRLIKTTDFVAWAGPVLVHALEDLINARAEFLLQYLQYDAAPAKDRLKLFTPDNATFIRYQTAVGNLYSLLVDRFAMKARIQRVPDCN